jgi:hypothetical protein
MPIDPQTGQPFNLDPTQGQPGPPQDPSNPGTPDPRAILAALFGPMSAPQAPQATPAPESTQQPYNNPDITGVEQNQSGKSGKTVDRLANLFRAGTGVSQQPSPIDAPDLAQFNREYNDPNSAYHVSPARRILQSFLTGIMAGPAALASEGFNPARQQKLEQWNTDQQRIMAAAHWNQLYNEKTIHEANVNARAEARNAITTAYHQQTAQQFQQNFGLSKERFALQEKNEAFNESIQTKKLNNRQLTREEQIFDKAYGPAGDQVFEQWSAQHPGKDIRDAKADPLFMDHVQRLYEQMKPQAAYNAAVQKMFLNHELDGKDISNQAEIFKAAQDPKSSLSAEEKNDVGTFLLPQIQQRAAGLERVNAASAGKLAVKETPPPQVAFVPDPNDPTRLRRFVIDQNTESVPANTMTLSGINHENQTPTAIQDQSAQAGDVTEAGRRLIEKIDKNRGQLGNWNAIWKSLVNNGPPANPFIAGLKADLASYAALNPKMHGFRGQNAFMQFENLIGGPMKNPDALIEAIRGVNNTAGIIQQSGTPFARSRGANPAPSGGNQGPTVHWDRDPKTGKLVKTVKP